MFSGISETRYKTCRRAPKMWLLLSLKMRELMSKMAPKARRPKLKGNWVEKAALGEKHGLRSLWGILVRYKMVLTANQNSVRAHLHL